MATVRCLFNKSIHVFQYLCTNNIIANVRHAWLDEWAVRAMGKELKLSSDGADSGSNEWKRGHGGAYGGVWRSVRLAGFVDLASVAVKNVEFQWTFPTLLFFYLNWSYSEISLCSTIGWAVEDASVTWQVNGYHRCTQRPIVRQTHKRSCETAWSTKDTSLVRV
jgi:hypothetical protein